MAINAANREHIINDVERRGDPKLAAILRSGQNAEFDEWYKNEWTPNNPDAPSDQDYDYRLMYEQGKMPAKSGDGALQFLPEEYWINRRGKAHTPPFGGFMPLPDADVNYDVNSGSWQFENGMMRMARKGAAKAYQTGLDMFAGGFTDYAADLGAYGGDREKARQDMEQALTPDVLEQAQINESETWGGAGEMIGSTLVEFGLYFATGGAGLKSKAEATVAKNGFNMGKLKGFLQGLGHRIEMASSPDAIGAEILYANNPENTESLASNLGNLLKENGVEGPVVDYLVSAKDDPYARVVSNIIEGMLFFEAARTVGHIGFKGGKAAWNKASEVVMSKYDEAVRELDTLQAALQTGMNLGLNPDAAAVRLRKMQNRKEGIGMQRNPRTVLQAEGKPDVVIGPQTKEDWKARVSNNLSDEEVAKARTWYKDIRAAFSPVFGERTDEFIAAWLIANKNESPAGALRNALRVAEQVQSGVQGKKGGLNDQALRDLFNGMGIEKGVGQKLVDFIDSATGRQTRQWMGDNPAGGKPAVIDVHSARDMGYVDDAYYNYLKENGYDVSNIEKDLLGSAPQETQYEVGAQQLRGLTDELNAEGWIGGNLEPSEVQAIGWVAQSKVTGAKAESPEEAILGNIRRVSYELAPGTGSPNAVNYGDRFFALDQAEQAYITKNVLEGASRKVNDLIGVQVSDIVFGLGGWQKTTNPAVVNQMLASPESAEVAANAIGYLAQQEQVWINKIKPFTKNPKGFAITLTGDHLGNDAAISSMWNKILENDSTDLIQGYQPVTAFGKPGIMILIDKGGKKTGERIDGEVRQMLEKMMADDINDILVDIGEAEITKTGTAGKYDGQGYLEQIKKLGRGDIIPDQLLTGANLKKSSPKTSKEPKQKEKAKAK